MPLTAETKLRRVIFRPYRKGCGPTFILDTWDTGRTGYNGKWLVGYRLVMAEPNPEWRGDVSRNAGPKTVRTVLFEGDEFSPGAGMCVDSDEAIEGLMGFLTLRPGDTDREYFDNYTPAQLEYCSQHAEALSCEVMRRFGRDG